MKIVGICLMIQTRIHKGCLAVIKGYSRKRHE